MQEVNPVPRRCRIDLMCFAELAIVNAMGEVEKMAADVRLTNAVNLLQQAKDSVADFIDGVPITKLMPPMKELNVEVSKMITVQQAIDLVNTEIRKSYSDPDYRVYRYVIYDWGWSMEWMPNDRNKIIYGSSIYLVHKNGFITTYNDIAWEFRHDILPGDDPINFFIKKAIPRDN